MRSTPSLTRPVVIAIGTVATLAALHGGARAADGDIPPTLSATDLTLTLARSDGSTRGDVLTTDELAVYFSLARCACPTNVVVSLAISSDAAATLGTHAVDAQFMVGNDCDDAQATGCVAVGSSVTLSAQKTSTSAGLTTSSIFAAASRSTCASASTTSTRLWAIVRLDGARLASEPSLALTLGGAGPKPPTEVKAQSADQGLLVSWTATGEGTTLQGHQALCAPGLASAATARYDTCGIGPAPDGGAGPFDAYDPQFVCSDLVAAGTSSVRVHGLQNGVSYQIAVVAVGVDGTPSAPSVIAEGMPAPTVGFNDLYKQVGGTAKGGCAIAGDGRRGAAWGLAIATALAGLVGRRRRGRRATLLAFVVAGAIGASASRPARAAPVEDAFTSPRKWNLELRFGPYRPDVDAEFADRADSARPYAELFSPSRHLMMQLEIDRQLSHRGGTWALGVGAGYFRVSAAALSADLQSRAGDETGLRLIPLSVSGVYRADGIRQRFGSWVVPYAKVGLDCTLWRATDTSQPAVAGRTFGWHAAAGLTLDLTLLDPEAGTAMDRESGVNQTALFFEVTRYDLDGFGSGSALHVGDTTWFAGLMLEL